MLVNRLPGPITIMSASSMARTASGCPSGLAGIRVNDRRWSAELPTRVSPIRVSPETLIPTSVTDLEVGGITGPRIASSSPATSTPPGRNLHRS